MHFVFAKNPLCSKETLGSVVLVREKFSEQMISKKQTYSDVAKSILGNVLVDL